MSIAMDDPLYNKTVRGLLTEQRRGLYNKTMAGGRPTDDPKDTLVAVRLSDRQLQPLQRRAKAESITLSEAVRRCVDHWVTTRPRTRPPTKEERETPRTRPPTKEERETFDQLRAVFGAAPAPRRRRRRK
jgi:hypothetical protein